MNNTKNWILGILAAVVLWHGMGYFSLASKAEGLDGKEGAVWNMVERANELLPRLENDMEVFMKDRVLIMEKIVDGRKVEVNVADEINDASADMRTAQDTNDVALASAAADRLRAAISVIVENYPDLGLQQAQIALMDETAGSINRIAYARGELIEAQTDYNKTRVYYPFINGMFPRENVLGSNEQYQDAQLQDSTFGE